MTQTPFQRALDGYEDAIFRLPAHRRRESIDRTLAQMRRTLPSDYRRTQRYEFRRLANDGTVCQHHAMVDAVNAFPAMRDRCVVSVAQAHHQRLWWLPFLLLWNSVTSGIDVFEYAANWWLVQQRWCPRGACGWALAALALVCADVRRMQAAGSRVPSWCLAWQRAPVVGLRVCAWRIGWLQGWQWLRRKSDTAAPQDKPDYAFLPSALRVALAAMALCAVLWPQHADAGVMTAALGAAGVIQVQTDGSDTNGGGYEGGGTDYTQQASAQVAVTDLVTTSGSTTVTSATASFTSGMTGNWCYITGGTGSITAKWFKFTYVSSTSGTLDTSTGISTGTGATFNLGGAFASPGRASNVGVAGNAYHIKAGSGYTFTTASTNTPTGCFAPIGGSSISTASTVAGFGSTRGDGTQAVFTLAGAVSTATMVSFSSNYFFCSFISVDGANNTSSRGIQVYSSYRCKAVNCKNACHFGGVVVRGEATGAGTSQAAFMLCSSSFGSEAYANAVNGYTQTAVTFCLSYGQTSSANGFTVPTNGGPLANLVAYGNSGSGVLSDGSNRAAVFANIISVGNSAYGANNSGSSVISVWLNLATYNNTSGATSGIPSANLIGAVTLSGDPFTNAASGDFSLNDTSGAGASCRAAGFPGPFPRGTTTGYVDTGAAQHANSASLVAPLIATQSPIIRVA